MKFVLKCFAVGAFPVGLFVWALVHHLDAMTKVAAGIFLGGSFFALSGAAGAFILDGIDAWRRRTR